MRKAGYAGKPYPYVECDLSDESELLVRGPNVFPGYWRNAEATAAAFRDGWLLTGDIAERDDEGYYRIRGRLKDMFVSGGENVYPAEIEAVLHDHPAVADAAVVGVAGRALGRGLRRVRRRRRRRSPTRSCASTAASGSRASRCRRRSASSTSCRATRSARCQKQELELEVRAMTDVVHRTSTGGTLSQRGLDTRAAPARCGRGGLRRARLPRRVDRQDHRGRRRRAGHLLPLLRLEAGDLRRARARPQPPRPPRDEGGAAQGRRGSSPSCSASRRTSASPPSIPRSTGSSARPSSSRPRCSATTTTALSEGYVEALRGGDGRGEIGEHRPEVTAWALMGLGELVGMRWILWGDGDDARAVTDELARIIRCILEAEE